MLMTCREVAEKMRVTCGTVYEWLRKGKLEYVQVGNKKLITEKAFEQLIKQNTKMARKEVKKRGRPSKYVT